MQTDLASVVRSNAESLLDTPSAQFKLSSLPTLIEFLNFQLNDINLYSLANNVGILKIYLLYPEASDVLVIQKILVLSLTQVPAPDFTVCLSQIPLYLHNEEPVSKVINLHNLLQNCMFLRFWETANSELESVPGKTVLDVSGLSDSVRKFVLDVLPLVYNQMAVPEVRKLLNFTSNCQEFEQLLSLCGWAFDPSYKREDEDSGLCYSTSREDSSKVHKSNANQNPLEKYLKSDPMKYYYNTLHN
ncbi:eukaryotic translation initiation factor 3 subunit II, putative [Theileria annulata]|uniref:Eukaryotic translation initiation factor 3 subunit K n=1 Tax=Theileria annulata TaxID=5874 RepID=Q4UE04_THEAN|nr:eukaryotic translation initiation factor 3 subunit II, putative [Theileria annulata]CAI74685.1 eukaryotic translation initiation factor 3 subunit II, putative [Theileria annulata]|eukprot:XP_952417.1 eukaryotic translation initiation factor 3 subunit II, putative [Theileria annulata]